MDCDVVNVMLFTVRAALRMNIDMVEGRSENNRQIDG